VQHGVVTPEAVILELPTAGVATRAFARLIDLFGQFVAALALGWVLVWMLGSAAPALAVLLVIFIVGIVLPIATEVIWRGRSPGKALFGLRVVGRDGAPESPRQAVVRGLVAIVDLYISFGFLAVSSSMVSPTAQRIGDLSAGTVVIRDRSRTSGRNPIAFEPPPGYEAFIASLDVGRLDEEDFSLIRSFLLRVHELAPSARIRLAAELAAWSKERLGINEPWDISNEMWLVCVASAFQYRRGGLMADAALGLAPIARPIPGESSQR